MWLQTAISDNLTGAEKVREFNEEHYAMTQLNAARAAAELFELNGEHFITAISSYTIYANYFEANVKPENIRLYQRVIREIELLKEIKRNVTLRKDKGNGRLHYKGYDAVYEDKGLEEFQRRQREKIKDGDTRHNRRKGVFRKLRIAGMFEE